MFDEIIPAMSTMNFLDPRYGQPRAGTPEDFSPAYFRLLIFSVLLCLVTYGFTLSNFSLSIDSEQVFFADTSLNLGRWGTNLVRYHIFRGIVPYFTLLLSLLLLSVTAVEIVKWLRLSLFMSYVFCGLFLTFPQMAYQLVFTMQADAVALGFLAAVFAIKFFGRFSRERLFWRSAACFAVSSLLFMFVIAIYQALAFIPVILYLIVLFQNTYVENYDFKAEARNGIWFIGLIIISVALYFISVKIFCPGASSGKFLSSYITGDSDHIFSHFFHLWGKHLAGYGYYGERTFIIVTIFAVVMGFGFLLRRRKFWILRITLLFLILLTPFIVSFFITSGYNPPRLYVASNIVFAFIIVHFISAIRLERKLLAPAAFIAVSHIYFITMLFWSHYRLYHHDIGVARNIDRSIYDKYPNFNPKKDYVYFFGHLPREEDRRFRLPHAGVFGGSFFVWDNGSNERIVNFMRFSDVAYYRYINNLDTYRQIKDSISAMPVWPQAGYVRRVGNVIIVKLGSTKGSPLWVEKKANLK